jgi:hypothetical protein
MLQAAIGQKKLRRWELALLLGLALSLLTGLWLEREQSMLADKVTSTIANSDSSTISAEASGARSHSARVQCASCQSAEGRVRRGGICRITPPPPKRCGSGTIFPCARLGRDMVPTNSERFSPSVGQLHPLRHRHRKGKD